MADEQKRAARIESEFQTLLDELRDQDEAMARICAAAGLPFEPTVPPPSPTKKAAPTIQAPQRPRIAGGMIAIRG